MRHGAPPRGDMGRAGVNFQKWGDRDHTVQRGSGVILFGAHDNGNGVTFGVL